MKMSKRQRAIGSKGVALEAARQEIVGATDAELPDILSWCGAFGSMCWLLRAAVRRPRPAQP